MRDDKSRGLGTTFPRAQESTRCMKACLQGSTMHHTWWFWSSATLGFLPQRAATRRSTHRWASCSLMGMGVVVSNNKSRDEVWICNVCSSQKGTGDRPNNSSAAHLASGWVYWAIINPEFITYSVEHAQGVTYRAQMTQSLLWHTHRSGSDLREPPTELSKLLQTAQPVWAFSLASDLPIEPRVPSWVDLDDFRSFPTLGFGLFPKPWLGSFTSWFLVNLLFKYLTWEQRDLVVCQLNV